MGLFGHFLLSSFTPSVWKKTDTFLSRLSTLPPPSPEKKKLTKQVIGIGRFRILGGPRFRILGAGGGKGGGGATPSRHMTSH